MEIKFQKPRNYARALRHRAKMQRIYDQQRKPRLLERWVFEWMLQPKDQEPMWFWYHSQAVYVMKFHILYGRPLHL